MASDVVDLRWRDRLVTDVIPVVDVAALVHPDADRDAVDLAVAEIGRACRQVGLFYVVGHGVSASDKVALLDATRRFFDLPLDVKSRLAMASSTQFRGYVPLLGEVTDGAADWHECIDLQPEWSEEQPGRLAVAIGRHPLDDAAQWPDGLPEFRDVMMQAWDRRSALASRIADAIGRSVGQPPGFFRKFEGSELCSLRLLHYPPPLGERDGSAHDAASGFGEHVDYGFLAVLQQDEVGGLEACTADGHWVPVAHRPDALVVNIGLMMQRWTNDRYLATRHRVRLAGEQSRYSMAFFAEPAYDTVIAPLPTCCVDDPPRYEPCVFGEMVTQLFSTAYGERADRDST